MPVFLFPPLGVSSRVETMALVAVNVLMTQVQLPSHPFHIKPDVGDPFKGNMSRNQDHFPRRRVPRCGGRGLEPWVKAAAPRDIPRQWLPREGSWL